MVHSLILKLQNFSPCWEVNFLCKKTRKSSCVNARGIPTAAYQVLHLRWGTPSPSSRGTPWPGPMGMYPTPPSPARSDGGCTQGGVPPGQVQQGGGYLRQVPPPAGPGWGTPLRLDLARVLPPSGVDRQDDGQTRVKTLPSRRTTYAVGKYL